MGKGILSFLIIWVVVPLAHEYQIPKDTAITYEEVMSPTPSLPPPISSPPPPQPSSSQQQPVEVGRNPPIPTSVSHYLGSHQQIDPCARDEVLVRGACHQLLTRGPCAQSEYVLLDPADHKGFCAARLCAPDRIFVFSDQLCHDPLNSMMCPPGRQLYQTAYGTPLCQCPDGTYEADDDLDDDVCQPLLSESLSCPPGQVLWFRDFTRPPECLPDPCGGKNLRRGPNDLPFVPSAEDGKCYQLGQMRGVCPAQTWYSLALQTLRGVCVSLEDAGYQVLDETTLYYLTQHYGSLISRETVPPSPPPASAPFLTSVSDPSPAPAPAIGPDSSPVVTLQTQGPDRIPLEQPQVSAGSQALSDRKEPDDEPDPGATGQAKTQGSLFSGQHISEDKKIPGLETYPHEYTEHEKFTEEKSIGQERLHQAETESAVHHHTSQTRVSAQGNRTRENSAQDFHDHGKNTARGQDTLNQPGSSTMTINNGVSFRKSPEQGMSQPAVGPLRGGSRSHPPHVTSTTSYSYPLPTHYSLPQNTNSQSSAVFPSHSQQQHAQSSPDTVSSPHYLLPNQQHPQSLPTQSSSSLPVSSAPAPSPHYSYPDHHAPLSPAPSTHYHPKQPQSSLVSPSLPHEPQPSTHYSQPDSTSPSLPQTSPALNHHLSSESLGSVTSHPIHLTRTSLERHQLSLEVLEGPSGRVVKDQHLSPSGNASTLSFPGSHVHFGSPSTTTTNGQRGSFHGTATWEQNQGQHPQHRGRRSTLPHASPGNVIEPLLAACRAGAQRDVNAKCREIVLPARTEGARDVRAAPPVPPQPTCPEGQAYGSKRKCVPTNEAINSINAFNLGK